MVVGVMLAGATLLTKADMDITAYLRDAGTANYSVTLESGSQLSAGNQVGLVDGVTSGGNGRLLLKRKLTTTPTYATNWSVVYTMKPQAHPDWLFKVNSFTIYRLNGPYDTIGRTARDFSLEGSLDGVTWTELYRTSEKLNWTNDTQKTFEIASAKRGAYNRYRFSMHPDLDASVDVEDEWHIGIHELVLMGEIADSRLVWNGSEGDDWTSSANPWQSLSAVTTNWVPRAKAYFAADGASPISVASTVAVGDLAFDAASTYAITGAALQVGEQVSVTSGLNTVIGNDLSYAAYSYDNWLPADPGNISNGVPVLLWRNRKLSETTPTTATLSQPPSTRETSAQLIRRSDDGLSLTTQFQYLIPNGGALLGAKVEFTQVGDDIWARLAKIWYSYVKGRQLGDDLEVANSDIYQYYVADEVVRNSGYALKGIQATGGLSDDPKTLKVVFQRSGCAREFDTWLPRSDTDAHTGKAITYWKNRKIRDLKDVVSGGICYNTDSSITTTVHCFANDGTKAVAQFQGNVKNNPNSARLCVKVEFTQSGDDIDARVVYVKYDWGNKGAHDFDSISVDDKIYVYDEYDSSHMFGYGVRAITGSFGGNLCLNGAVNDHRIAVEDGDGVLTLGMSSVSLDAVSPGDATVEFKPAAESQAVVVSGTISLGKAIFSGVTSVNLTSGASFSVDSFLLDPAAVLDFTAEATDRAVRLGSASCLTQAQIGRIAFNGRPVRQTSDGWIVPRQGLQVLCR